MCPVALIRGGGKAGMEKSAGLLELLLVCK